MINEKGKNVLDSLSRSKAKLADDKEIINLALENSDYNGLTGGSWWEDRSLEWIKTNQDIVEKIVKKKLPNLVNDKPDLELKKFNKENYIHQSAVLISKTLDFFLAISLLSIFVSYCWGERRLFYLILVSISFPIIVFIFFETILGLRFPPGIITNIYYQV